jgi:hypothetical protein
VAAQPGGGAVAQARVGTRPAVTTIVIVPLVVGLLLDELGYGLIATLGALKIA